MTTIINKIRLAATGQDVDVHIATDTGAMFIYETTVKDLPLFLIELASYYGDIEGVASKHVTQDPAVLAALQGLRTALPGVAIEANERFVLASTFSGDARADVTDASLSVLTALAKLLTTNGFKTKAFQGAEYTGDLTAHLWLEDFRYGFKRRSDEKLQEELEGLLKPDIGAW